MGRFPNKYIFVKLRISSFLPLPVKLNSSVLKISRLSSRIASEDSKKAKIRIVTGLSILSDSCGLYCYSSVQLYFTQSMAFFQGRRTLEKGKLAKNRESFSYTSEGVVHFCVEPWHFTPGTYFYTTE